MRTARVAPSLPRPDWVHSNSDAIVAPARITCSKSLLRQWASGYQDISTSQQNEGSHYLPINPSQAMFHSTYGILSWDASRQHES